MSGVIKNVALVGASGSLGSIIFKQLLASNKFKVRVLRRNGSSSTFAPGIDVVDVDFDSVDSIKAALADQDAIVAALGDFALDLQKRLADAAATAGVKRFIPSSFGGDLANPKTRQLPGLTEKAMAIDYLAEKAKTTSLTYTPICNGTFLDWGLSNNMLLDSSDFKPIIYDGGDIAFSTSTMTTAADAVVGVLLCPEKTNNRFVYVEDIRVTQNKLLALVQEVVPEKPWRAQQASLNDATQRSDERLAKGTFDFETFSPYILRATLDPAYGGVFHKTDNELLGIKGKTEKELVDVVKGVFSKN